MRVEVAMLGQVQDVDIKMLRLFRTVVRHGGFAAAQTELNVSLPTISNQMKQLEDRLGVRLCDRGALGFRLTDEGDQVVKATDRLFEALDRFRDDLSGLAKHQLGEVRLGIIDNLTSNPSCRVHDAIQSLQARLAGVGVSFFVGPPGELESRVLNGALDLAVGLFPSQTPSISYQALFEEEHWLFCGRGHPLFEVAAAGVQVDDLRAARYVSWAYLEPYVTAQAPLRLEPATGTAFMEGMVCLLLSGRYIGYLPRHFAQRWVDTGELKCLAPAETSRRVEITLITRRNQSHKTTVLELQGEIQRVHGLEVGRVGRVDSLEHVARVG
jgi:LysR family transcriptional regulator, transcriptional activator for bauABCD operon